jgi:hypothetical protein
MKPWRIVSRLGVGRRVFAGTSESGALALDPQASFCGAAAGALPKRAKPRMQRRRFPGRRRGEFDA